MPAKKALSTTSSHRDVQKELEYLYARKSALDALIQSLENYDRYRSQSVVYDRFEANDVIAVDRRLG